MESEGLKAEEVMRCAACAVDNNEDPADDGVSDTKELKEPKETLSVRIPMRDEVDGDESRDFGIAPGTLEVVTVSRRQWMHPHEPPLPIPSPEESPIIEELTRSWRALRLKAPFVTDGIIKRKELSAERVLLKNYEPRFVAGEPTFPSEIHIPGYLQPRIAIEEATAYLISLRLQFALGMIETLYCRLAIYDVHLGCRIAEEFSFTIPVHSGGKPITVPPPSAIFYVLPNYSSQHLYLVVKVSKVLLGDSDSATAPYCNPEKYTSDNEKQRLTERTADTSRRLGRYQQPLAWGAIALAEGSRRSMILYRQRNTIGDEQRFPLVVEAARGTLKEKAIPSRCEVDVERLDDQRLEEAKFQMKSITAVTKTTPKLPTSPILDVYDPFTKRPIPSLPQQTEEAQVETLNMNAVAFQQCREVQPFCHSSSVSCFGLYGSGPVATAYMNVMYIYPLHVDKFQFRNIAVRIQLLQKEVEFVCGMDEFDNQHAVVTAFYDHDQGVVSSAFTHVNYHQKNPQFEKEVKLCLPEQLTMSHHLLFTFYHVHCKKLQPSHQQQELVGCAWLPILDQNGALLNDREYSLTVISASNASRNSTSGGIVSLPTGYIDSTRKTHGVDISKTTFTCRAQTLSSTRSQDSRISQFLDPFYARDSGGGSTSTDTDICARLEALAHVPQDIIRHFLIPTMRFVMVYMRFGSASVRQTSFRALLTVFQKATWTSHRSGKAQDLNQILLDYASFVFDEKVVETCAFRVGGGSAPDAGCPPHTTMQAIAMELSHLLKDKSSGDEMTSMRKMSLHFSPVLLQLILKALATQRTSRHVVLPAYLCEEDEVLLEDLLMELIERTTDTNIGLLFQKDVNVSIVAFCRGLFLVSKSVLPFRIVEYFLGWTQRMHGNVNVTVHILFPFLGSMVEYEFFAYVNGFQSSSTEVDENTRGRRGAWLARMIFERLLKVVDEEVEDRIRSEALRLLRRMFVGQVYNPRHQTIEHQELIALMFFPMVPHIAQFTTDGKLLSAGAALADAVDSIDIERSSTHRKEMLVCVAHLLSSVTLPYVSWYFRQSVTPFGSSTVSNNDIATPLSPTASLMHYRRLVEETKLNTADGRRKSLIQRNLDTAFGSTASSTSAYDEVRVHACLSLIRQVIEAFLVDETAQPSFSCLQILSPDLAAQDTRTSLFDLETNHKQRHSRHRVGSVGQEAVIVHRTSTATGNRSPNSRNAHSSGSFSGSLSANTGPTRLTTQKSLPRNWGKAYTAGQHRESMSSSGEMTSWSLSHHQGCSGRGKARSCEELSSADAPGEEFETNIRNLHKIIAETSLKALRTAVDQFEWVIRLIEVPLDFRKNNQLRSLSDNVSMEQAFALLGSIVDVFFLLMKRASSIVCLCTKAEEDEQEETNEECDEAPGCFLADLFRHLHTFLLRFQKSLFATRITGLPLIHDQSRVFLLVLLSATAKLFGVRLLSSSLLCRLIQVCYEQTGSFLLITRPLLRVFCANFFSTSALQIPNDALRDAIDLWRQQYPLDQDGNTRGLAFELQFNDMLNGLTSQIKVFETWHHAVTQGDLTVDFEELEEGLYRIVQSVSSHWLLEVKVQWMNALVQLHATRKQFGEAAFCTLEMITFKLEQAVRADSEPIPPWLPGDLKVARELALKAGWSEKAIEIGERLLQVLRTSGRFSEYQEVLRSLDVAVGQLGESRLQGGDQGGISTFAFYRVVFGGDCVPMSVAKNEYVYKRSKFTSLGEFVSEMKAVVRARFPMCERVDILPESKPFPAFDRHPNVVFMRVTNVEPVYENEKEQQRERATFKFSIPFTLGGAGSYGKTAEQMKRVTYLTTSRAFPCATSRHVVVLRREQVRCPIDNSMDDIRKRCVLLRDEIDKEACRRTDLKTLTLVLKGSVDTHVHGGIPEVIDAFLAPTALSASLPELIDAHGSPMDETKSVDKREELADLLVEFLELCWACLLISRLAFRRSASTTSSSSSVPLPLSDPSNGISASATTTQTKHHSLGSGALASIGRLLATLDIPVVADDEASLSPLQVEFEKSFATLVDLMRSRVAFAYPRDGDLVALSLHVQAHRRPRLSHALPPPPSNTPQPPPPPSSPQPTP